MSIKMQLFKSGDDVKISNGWDISELVHDIEYTTSIMGQAGKLSFAIEKDTGNSGFQISMGDCVLFWHNDNKVFKGYIFSAETNIDESFRVVAYDQLRYLQFHSNEIIKDDMNIEDVFNKIILEVGIPKENTKIVGNIDKSIKIKSKIFTDTSYYEILKYAIDWTNSFALTAEVENLQEIKIGDEVFYSGGKSYAGANDTSPATSNRVSGNAKVTNISANGIHKYHLRGDLASSNNSNVYGWVDESTITNITTMNKLLDNFYYLRDNFGTLELRETKYCGTYDENGNKIQNWLIIGDGSLLTDYTYQVDIDRNTFNEFLFMYNPKNKNSSDSETNKQVQGATLVGAIQAGSTIQKTGTSLDNTKVGENTIPKWGKLRKIVTVNDVSDKDLLAKYMKINVEHFNQPTRSLKLSALGYDGVYAGDTFHLLLGKLQMNTAVYVLNATHRYNGDMHTMELEVNTSPDIKVFS